MRRKKRQQRRKRKRKFALFVDGLCDSVLPRMLQTLFGWHEEGKEDINTPTHNNTSSSLSFSQTHTQSLSLFPSLPLHKPQQKSTSPIKILSPSPLLFPYQECGSIVVCTVHHPEPRGRPHAHCAIVMPRVHMRHVEAFVFVIAVMCTV